MSNLNNLINELCPNGVEYKKIQEICDVTTDYTAAGSFGDIAKNVKYNSIPDFAQLVRTMDLKSGFTSKNQVFVDEHAFKYLWRVNLNKESLILPNIGNCGEVYYIRPSDLPYTNNVLGPNAILVRSSSVNNRFLFHLFQGEEFQTKLNKITSTTGQGKYNKTDFRNLEIPVPPLPIQEEIVRVLDNFTELTTELTTELQDRKKQYEYYRDSLLAFKSDFKKIYLGEIGKVCMCKRIMKEQTSSTGDVPFYKIGTFGKEPDAFISKELFNEYKNKYSYPKKGDILISCSGTIGRTVVFDGNDAYFQDSNIVWIDNDEKIAINRYLYYVYQLMPFKISTGGTIARLYNEGIEKAEICVPCLEVQQKIVNVLDNFEKICNDLKIGLPAEIELRQKQYEYYRDMLLTFPENDLCLSKQASKHSYNYDEINLLQYVYGFVEVKFGDIANIVRGASPRPIQNFITNSIDGVNWIKIGDVETNAKYVTKTAERITMDGAKKSRYVKKGDFILSNSMSFGRPYILKIDGCIHDGWLAISGFSNLCNSDYLYHLLSSTKIQNTMRQKASFGGAVQNLNADIVRDLDIILPSLDEQQRIVSILDKFDKYCNDISEGLPSEIKYRQQQYEYYRDKLLNFKRLN